VFSSSEELYEEGNGCTGPIPIDNIKLSSNELRFNAEGGIDSITTKGEDWNMLELNIGDTTINLLHKEYHIQGEPEYYLYESGTILTDEENGYVISIEHPWFSINKPENKKIIFSVNKNETGKERTFFIRIIDYRNNYYTSIKVSQSAE
jgi:hypothetical protein